LTSERPADHVERSNAERRLFVPTVIAISSLLFLFAATVLYYRWVTMSEPRCVIVVEAGPALKGAEVTVDGAMLIKPLKTTVGKDGRYAIPFYLDAGEYEVVVKLDDQTLHQSRVTVSESARGWRIDLSKMKPATAPTVPTELGTQ
jgi:hypothetical protein